MTNNFKNKVDSYLSSEIGKLFIRYKNDAKDIDYTEKELGITIDDALKYVLLTYGGAYIGVDLSPCSKDPNNKNQETILDYTKSIRDYYKETNVCHSIQSGYVISIEGNGDIIFIDSENKVKIFYHDTNEEELLAKNFESFIIDSISIV
ncbi:SMI1/KNR4 family protein [Capnocytophaga endodontalis]|uniref:Knr4/Smi1-like domain-containing protein n=1 Tax=Capnocytophaga endodontalis TaxID=2708117 RepID=A0A1Z4BS71_9FLAO|nr:SMI1/KNR4 family protein [Capnocytophaga endodontalis]ASF44083.1 hypothetical protein CBG49_13830 [Capnocytophaga endodontalis]